METVRQVADLKQWVAKRRLAGSRIGFVPTMGYLHQGHIALIEDCRHRADATVLSCFVNPLQFGPGEDFDHYPRDDARDDEIARSHGVDLLFRPTVEVMYPADSVTRVLPGPAGDAWEGTMRPGHFEGVLTVVAKLFHLVDPDVACFGQKDIQQATLIRQMVRDFNWEIDIEVVPTVREADGLALSSRNVYLSPDQRRQALGLSIALQAAAQAWRQGDRTGAAIEGRMRNALEVFGGLEIEYIGVLEPESFTKVTQAEPGTVVVIAGRIGRTRLIDNIVLGS